MILHTTTRSLAEFDLQHDTAPASSVETYMFGIDASQLIAFKDNFITTNLTFVMGNVHLTTFFDEPNYKLGATGSAHTSTLVNLNEAKFK